MTVAERERIRSVATLLKRAERPVRILRSVSWPNEVRERFFATGARELPQVSYAPADPMPTLELVAQARALLRSEGAIDAWLGRQAEAIENSARMLSVLGTPEFFVWSRRLYGAPRDPLLDGTTTSLGLAEQLDGILATLGRVDLGAPAPACHLSWAVAEKMRAAVAEHFGELAPEVVVVDELASNALAGPRAIRLRRTACFTDRDVDQLIHHEAYIHVGTTLNGQQQPDLPILGASHAGTTRTQEGLAVFAELASATLDVDRLARLAARVLAIEMAIDGADFLDVYRFFLARGSEPQQAYESARRVFRGGVLEGGAPFTKDIVYLDGLLRVHNFLRSAVAAGRADCLRLLFCGKLDIDDVPALCELAVAGLCRPPRFLPPWAGDLRFLIAYLSYSAFLNQVDLKRIRAHFETLLASAPRVELPGEA
ncbi:MAG: DUF1704 domain-containing protein [Thermoanaerobaculia bacterium]|nr:DUF1704 domain-containing protein [Thermoanaerobaculia bacterium]